MFLVICFLYGTPTRGFLNRPLHRIGHPVRVKNDFAVDVPRGSPKGLNQGSGRSQKAFLIRVQDCHQRNLWQVQPLTQEVDPNHNVKYPQAQIAQDPNPFEGLHLGMQVMHFETGFQQVVRHIFCHALG